ncbi:hypothetical protein NG793_24250 [Laspinema sp. C5]|nr:hypothetical protein [Laspinema sp. D3c]
MGYSPKSVKLIFIILTQLMDKSLENEQKEIWYDKRCDRNFYPLANLSYWIRVEMAIAS